MRKRYLLSFIIALFCGALFSSANNVRAAEIAKHRYFMFIGQPNSAGWQVALKDPVDRKEVVSGAIKQLGGEVLSYYWGLGNGRNYITMKLPNDNQLIQAIYLSRLPTGILTSYQVIELMPSDQAAEAMKKANKLISTDKTLK